jgi:hypothetical protein
MRMLKLLLSRLDPKLIWFGDAGLTQTGFYDWQGLEHGRTIPLPAIQQALR